MTHRSEPPPAVGPTRPGRTHASPLEAVVPDTDAELLRAAGTDLDAFVVVYDRYGDRLFGYFVRRTADREVAAELTAETFSRAWVMREHFEDRFEGSAAPWLFGIARNVLMMSVRRGAVERLAAERLGVLERLDLGGGSSPAPEPRWTEGADELLDSLPLGQGEALRLRILDELSYDEVAAALGTTRSAARVRVHRGLAALRRRFSDREEDQG
jgi:RNA polymerase sigma-70 factor (ECF subfamily)